jgi:hypothetical protein
MAPVGRRDHRDDGSVLRGLAWGLLFDAIIIIPVYLFCKLKGWI